MSKAQYPPLEPGKIYHVYNRGNNSQDVFHSDFEVACFLNAWKRLVSPLVETFAYNILKNHFHIVLRTKERFLNPDSGELEDVTILSLRRAFSRFFITFAMTMHARHGSNGAVFKRRFQRKEIETTDQLHRVIAYTLFNAKRHGLTDDARSYKNSSFRFLGDTPPAFLAQDEMCALVGGLDTLDHYLQAYEAYYFGAVDGLHVSSSPCGNAAPG